MKRFNRLQRILISAILVVVLFGSVMLSLRQNTMTNVGYSAWIYIKYGLIDYPLTSFGNVINDVSNLWHVYDDNIYLNEQLATQRSYQTMYQEERNRTLELEELLDMQDILGDALKINCTVVNRPIQNWNQSITISAGKNQGVEENMLVSSSEGVIGLVDHVETFTSTVQLLTSPELRNDIAVQIAMEDGTTVEGVLQSYNANRKAYEVNLFDHNAAVTNGQKVATSGKGGNYPSGVLIGTVESTVIGDDAIVSTIYVKPVSNIQDFNYVTVIGMSANS